MNKLFTTLLTASLFLITSAQTVFAAPWTFDKCVRNVTVPTGIFSRSTVPNIATLEGVECAFSNIVSIVLALAGIALFIMLLNGGFKFLTSGGDQKQVEAAKGTLSQAIAGLVVLILSYVVIKLIADITGAASILNFKIVE